MFGTIVFTCLDLGPNTVDTEVYAFTLLLLLLLLFIVYARIPLQCVSRYWEKCEQYPPDSNLCPSQTALSRPNNAISFPFLIPARKNKDIFFFFFFNGPTINTITILYGFANRVSRPMFFFFFFLRRLFRPGHTRRTFLTGLYRHVGASRRKSLDGVIDFLSTQRSPKLGIAVRLTARIRYHR